MGGRISRPVMFMQMARIASQRSTCHRLNVGAIVAHENSPVSIGWNGQEPGAAHCAGNDCPGIVPGNCGTLHAEHNALTKAVDLLDPSTKIDLYVTDSPCPQCCLMIRNCALDIRRIFFEKPYRERQHLSMFADPYPDPEHEGRKRITAIYEVTPAGYIVEYFTRQVEEIPQ